MSASDDSRTLGRARLGFAKETDIDEFVDTLSRFESGEITSEQWRAFRLLRGTYGQRQEADAQMLRVKIPQGLLTAAQLDALADVAEEHSRGFGHITTRQNLQFHFVRMRDLDPAMRRLAQEGLTTREACGNSVRNITACPYAGVAADEVFDVTPYAEALTRHLLRHPLSSALPRKFKIAFEGCPEDHALTSINDIGFRARVQHIDGKPRRGFQIAIGGGTATLCRSAQVVHEFLPAAELFSVAEALLRVFQRLGDYQHRHKNRMKYLIKSLGWERFRAEYDAERAAFLAAADPAQAALPFDPEDPPREEAPSWPRAEPLSQVEARALAGSARLRGPGILPVLGATRQDHLARFRLTNVRPQRQPGYAQVVVTLPLGDVTGAQLRVLARLAQGHGDGTVRVTPEQDLVLRWVRESEVPQLYRTLAAAGLGLPDAGTVADVTSCPGAESCRLAVTQSRGLAQLLHEALVARPDLVAAAPDLQIKISGCPNGCGQHHVAGLGFQGGVRKIDGRAVPQYFVLAGGALGDTGARFGKVVAKVPARRIPQVVERLILLYQAERAPGEAAAAFLGRLPAARLKQVLADLEQLTEEEARAEDFIDLGESEAFAAVDETEAA